MYLWIFFYGYLLPSTQLHLPPPLPKRFCDFDFESLPKSIKSIRASPGVLPFLKKLCQRRGETELCLALFAFLLQIIPLQIGSWILDIFYGCTQAIVSAPQCFIDSSTNPQDTYMTKTGTPFLCSKIWCWWALARSANSSAPENCREQKQQANDKFPDLLGLSGLAGAPSCQF